MLASWKVPFLNVGLATNFAGIALALPNDTPALRALSAQNRTPAPRSGREAPARRGETACRWVLGRDDVRALRRLTAGRTTVRAEVGP